MSSRALRKLQKENVPDISNAEELEDSEVEEHIEIKPKFNPFDLLNDDDDNAVEEEEEEEEQMKDNDPEPIKPVSKSKSKKGKKGKKNNKENSNQKSDIKDLSMKELDMVLKELPKHKKSKNKSNIDTEESRWFLSVNHRFLDAEAEMKRLFGSHVVNSEGQSYRARTKKSNLTTPKSDWPPYKRNGLSMELIETKEDGKTYFAFRHSELYQDVQLEFLNALATHNPEALLFLVRRHPYHVDALLQLSEIAKHSGDWTAAGDFIERALYACEKAFHPQFSTNTGAVRLSYKRSENRSFFLAIFRHIQFLTRRGCWRTAFEFNKLLFSLDPISDPLSALLSLDFHALSAKEYEYVVRLQDEWKTDGQLYPTDLAHMPNFAFSSAYAKFKLAEKCKNSAQLKLSSNMIQEAIKKYPRTYCRLLEKLGETMPNKASQLEQHASNQYMDIVQVSYVERTYEMWKEPEVLEWFKTNGSQALDYVVQHPNIIQQKINCVQKDTVPQSLCRYIMLIDVQKLMSYLPSSVTSQTIQMYDPLPPADSETMYDINSRLTQQNILGLPTSAGGIMNMLQNLVGRGDLPQATQGQIRQLMQELEQTRQQNINTIPGAFPGAENDEDNEDNGEEGEEEEEREEYEHIEDAEGLPETMDIASEFINNQHISEEEMLQILNAIGEDELEAQMALASAFERNNENNNQQ